MRNLLGGEIICKISALSVSDIIGIGARLKVSKVSKLQDERVSTIQTDIT